MAVEKSTQRLVLLFIKHTQNPSFPLEAFVSFSKHYIDRSAKAAEEFKDIAQDAITNLETGLRFLQEQGECILDITGSTITNVHYLKYYYSAIESYYKKVTNNYDLPFPTETMARASIPPRFIDIVDVKTDFLERLNQAGEKSNSIIRLRFPEGLREMIVTGRVIEKILLDLSLQKVRNYLRTEKNSSYIKQKLLGIFRQKEVSLKENMNSILMRLDQVKKDIMTPSDFTYHFWTQLTSVIIKEFIGKKDKLEEETGYCQSCFIINQFIMFYKGQMRNEKEQETAMRQLELSFNHQPYAFTITDIQNFKDDKGLLLSKKIPREKIHAFLEERTKPKDNISLPPIIRIRLKDSSEYFIRKEYVIPVFIEKLNNLSHGLREEIINEWFELLNDDRIDSAMNDDREFHNDIVSRLRKKDTLFPAMLNYSLLFLCRGESDGTYSNHPDMARIFNETERSLIPLQAILYLDREEMLKEAKLLLPFWKVIPVLSQLIVFFKKIFSPQRAEQKFSERRVQKARTQTASHKAEKEPVEEKKTSTTTNKTITSSKTLSPAATAKAQKAEFKKAVSALISEMVPQGLSIDDTMKSLIAKWNPLLDESAKKNLVEDVNSLIRDFIRKMRILNNRKPPAKSRLTEMATNLANNETFERIKKRDAFRQYIELYMLKVLHKS